MDVKNIIIGVMAIIIIILLAKGSGGGSEPSEPTEKGLKSLPEQPDQAKRVGDEAPQIAPQPSGQEGDGNVDEGGGGGPDQELEAEAPDAEIEATEAEPEGSSEKEQSEKETGEEQQKEQGEEGEKKGEAEQHETSGEEGGVAEEKSGDEGENEGGEEEAGEKGAQEEGEVGEQGGEEEGGLQNEGEEGSAEEDGASGEEIQSISEEEKSGLAEEGEFGLRSLTEESNEEQAQLKVSEEDGAEVLQPELQVQGEEEGEPISEEILALKYGEEEQREPSAEEGIPSVGEENLGEEGISAEIGSEEEGFHAQQIFGEEEGYPLESEELTPLQSEEGSSYFMEEGSSFIAEEGSSILVEEGSLFQAEEGSPLLTEDHPSFITEEGTLAEEGFPNIKSESELIAEEGQVEGSLLFSEEGLVFSTEEGSSLVFSEESTKGESLFFNEEGEPHEVQESASQISEKGEESIQIETAIEFSEEGEELSFKFGSQIGEEGVEPFKSSVLESEFSEESGMEFEVNIEQEPDFSDEGGIIHEPAEGSIDFEESQETQVSEKSQRDNLEFEESQGSQISEFEPSEDYIVLPSSSSDEQEIEYSEEGSIFQYAQELSSEIGEEVGIVFEEGSPPSEFGSEPELISEDYELDSSRFEPGYRAERSSNRGIEFKSEYETDQEPEMSSEEQILESKYTQGDFESEYELEMSSEEQIIESKYSESESEKEFESQISLNEFETENEPEMSSEEQILESVNESENQVSEHESEIISEGVSEKMSEKEGDKESENEVENDTEGEFKSEIQGEDAGEGKRQSQGEGEKEINGEEESEIQGEDAGEGEQESQGEGEKEKEINGEVESEIQGEDAGEGEQESEGEVQSEIQGEIESNWFEGENEEMLSEYEIESYMEESEEEEQFKILLWNQEDEDQPKNVSYDQDELFADFTAEVDKANEYAAGVWVKWLRAYPRLLRKQSPIHSIFRMTSIKDHQDEGEMGDRLLSAFITKEDFHFSTSCQETEEFVSLNIPYDDIDGQWNFLYFGYKRHYGHPSGSAAAWVYSTETQGQIAKAKHDFLHGYVHFLMGREFDYPFFNGQMAKAHFQVGHGSYLGEESAFHLILSKMKLSSSFYYHYKDGAGRISKRVNNEKIGCDGEALDPIRPSIIREAREYSVSGWARLLEQDLAWMLIFRLAQQNEQLTDSEIPGDRTLYIGSQGGNYHMQTYSCEKSECQIKIGQQVQNSLFGRHWTWFYFGYRKGEAYAHIENTLVEKGFNFEDIHHFSLVNWVLYLQKDPFHACFNGQFYQWQINIGSGSFITSEWEDFETETVNYAYDTELMELLKGYEHPEPINVQYDDTSTSLVIELEDTDDISLDGITQYGVGFWSRFLYNGRSKIIEKPDWMGLMSLQSERDQDDFQLSVIVRQGYYEFASNDELFEIDYGVELDGQWVYIQFSYSYEYRAATGYVWWSQSDIEQAQFEDVIHPALSTYLKVSIGSYSPKLKGFNGQIEKIQIKLGLDAYYVDQDALTDYLLDDLPVIKPFQIEEKEIIQETVRFIRESNIEPDEISTIEVTEYSIGVWFRAIEAPVVPLQVLYVLVSNEPEYLANIAKPGDRTLGLYVTRYQSVYFSTYTLLEDDGFKYIPHKCNINMENRYSWIYTYFGYTRNEAYAYLLNGNEECSVKLNVIHQIPNYLGLYVGVDPFHPGFYGKMAYFYIEIGDGAYTSTLIQEKKSYHLGQQEFLANDYIQKAFYDLTLNSVGQAIKYEWEDGDTADTNIDGISEYSITFWYQYLFTYPERVYDLPLWSQIIRLSSSESQTDSDQPGDRTLAVFIRDIAYHFSTYSIHDENHAPVAVDIENDYIDGIWTKISFSFYQKLMQAQAYVEINDEIDEQTLEQILHYPLDQHCWLYIGQQFIYPGANGIMSQLNVALGPGTFVSSDEIFKQLLLIPRIEQQYQNKFDIITNDEEINENIVITPFEFKCIDDYNQQYDQYSLSGWYKWDRYTNQPYDCNIIFRLTTTEPDYLDDSIDLGDRTLAGHYCYDNYIFSTYNFTDPNLHSIQIPVDEYYAQWTYFYFGYNRNEKNVQFYLAYPNNDVYTQLDNILHLIPNYIALYIGMDGIDLQFFGIVKYWQFNLGPGSYAKPHHQSIIEVLPYYFNHKFEPQLQFQLDDNKYIVSSDDNDAYIIQFGPEIEGTYVYSIGVWTRWLEYYPSLIQSRRKYHSVFRMASNEIYQDVAQLGDRILTVLVSKNGYIFSTYDSVHDITSTNKQIPYANYFEGHWNYVYFGYKFDSSIPMAIGYIYFSVNQNIEQVEFYSLKHNIMGPYAIVKFGAKEFQYQPFHGQFYDPRINFGIQNSFFQDSNLLQQYIDAIALEPAPDSDVPLKYTFLEEELTYSSEDDTVQYIREAFNDIGFIKEYAVSGWAQVNDIIFDENMAMIVFRLSNNEIDIIDDGDIGDRTLTVILKGSGFEFSTYDYADESDNDDDFYENEIVEYNGLEKEWVFYYFGYSFNEKQASLFLRYSDGSEYTSIIDDIYHYVACDLYLQIGMDRIYTPYDGTMFGWTLNLGQNAFSKQPTDFINSYPSSQIPSFITLKTIEKQIKKQQEKLFLVAQT